MRSSRLGGVPTTLPPPGTPGAGQMALGLAPRANRAPPGATARPLPGVTHVPGWLVAEEQPALVAQFREWAVPPAGLRHPRVPTGHLMTVQSVCLGWHWQPYAYSRTADDTDGAPVKPLPDSSRRRSPAGPPSSRRHRCRRLRPRRRHREPLRPRRPPRPAPGRRGAVRRPGRHDQPRRRLHLPLGRHRSPHRPVHRRPPPSPATCSSSAA